MEDLEKQKKFLIKMQNFMIVLHSDLRFFTEDSSSLILFLKSSSTFLLVHLSLQSHKAKKVDFCARYSFQCFISFNLINPHNNFIN